MDFTPELLMFQGAITSADNVHKFSRLTSKGGNNDKVNFVTQSIKRFLHMERYVDENGLIDALVPTTRKFAMYIMLNADLTILQDMMDISEIESVIWTIPTIPKYLMCEMLWQFNMDKFVYEIIANCWPQLALEVAEAFLLHFKYFDPTECLDKLQKLSMACYTLLCRLTCLNFEDDVLSTILPTGYSVFEKFLKYYIDPPNKYKLDILNDDDLYKYKGKRLESILHLVYNCCSKFEQNYNPNCDDSVYKLTHYEGYVQNTAHKVCESQNKLIIECLNTSNTLLLDIFKEIVMDVSVDVFCAWSEYEEEGKSVQQIIGELCDKIHKKLQGISSLLEHPVIPMIQLLARKPTELKDIVNSVNTETILQKINANDEESSEWIHALVHKEHLWQDLKLINIVQSRLSIFDDQESFLLYNALKDIVPSNIDDNEILIELKIKLLEKCNITDKIKILKDHFHDKIFSNTIVDQHYEINVNKIFNKFTADPDYTDVDFKDVPILFYQNPKRVYIKICNSAAINTQLLKPMVKLMLLFKDFADHYYTNDTEPCLIMIMRSMAYHSWLNSKPRNNFVEFVCELKKHDIVSGSSLLMLVIMPNLHSALLDNNILRMHIHVQLLTEAYTMTELLKYRAPMLAMMAQVMESVRCRDLHKFQVNAHQTLALAIKFQSSIMNNYGGQIPANDGHWLRLKMRDLHIHPMNAHYFRSLWNLDSANFFESVSKKCINRNADLTVLAGHLLQMIPRAILEEWCAIWDSFTEGGIREKLVLHLFYSVLDELTKWVEANRSANSLACLFYYYQNLMHIIRYKFFQEPLSNSQVKTCVKLLSNNLGRANAEDVEEISTIIGPLLSYLVERKQDYSVNIIEYFRNNNYFNVVCRYVSMTPENNE